MRKTVGSAIIVSHYCAFHFVRVFSHGNHLSLSLTQIDRGGVTLKARLAQLLTEGTSANPRWLIKFDGQPYKDEEVYEHTFGKLLIAADDEPEQVIVIVPEVPARRTNSSSSKSTSTGSNSSSGRNGKTSPKSKNNNNDDDDAIVVAVDAMAEGVPSNDEQGVAEEGDVNGEAVDDDDDKKKSVSFSNENSPTGSDESCTPKEEASGQGGVTSTREARSKRRQAMIDESGGVLASATASSAANYGAKRARMPNGGKNGKAVSNKRPRDGKEQVVKVKLLTGTLFLYRGQHRRAEFIRRV